ncbi:VIT1/CCC1 transporter family protein [Sphingosinicella sp. YJ22]|uniref:VIT1/CCC1 transporter family protein n=1 Tax=Sphingosinicella sp. YJ22 TaxID=1104780 RepID=UPI00140A669A|nr:VIT1/CCC1 transporter family protein [Sphingosinicella sp. YJ22]
MISPAATECRDLEEEHRPARIRERISRPKGEGAIGDFVLGGVDGVVTTFAVVAGSAGARLPIMTVIVLGLANLAADGFSMAVSNYLGTRSRQQEVRRARADEDWQTHACPEGERAEIREIFSRKGFEPPELDRIVAVISSDRRVWVDTMMQEELRLSEISAKPLRAGVVTFVAFSLCGFIPLLPFILGGPSELLFTRSTVLAGATFFILGLFKGAVVGGSRLVSGVQTLAVGSAAAMLAFAVGALLRDAFGLVT